MQEINVLIEIPKSSMVKYEVDKATGLLVVDRFIYTAMGYPFNYGYLPDTSSKDGDPVDVMVVSTYPVQAGSVLPSRVIGMLEMEDEAGIDNKIIAVPTKKVDPFYASIQDLSDLNEATKKLIKHFFEQYKDIEPGKWTKVRNFLGKEEAWREIEESRIK
ncbi:MAG TPA: inorganic diphosphatase [Candidatus Babeliales bacterium]|jgi:inorganic pyrophosphatase|nr:inorganic diphosphatase [Candidatus Babeliales bacterium]